MSSMLDYRIERVQEAIEGMGRELAASREESPTLRDYFAAHAMHGLLAADSEFSMNGTTVANLAYEQADAMMKVREEK